MAFTWVTFFFCGIICRIFAIGEMCADDNYLSIVMIALLSVTTIISIFLKGNERKITLILLGAFIFRMLLLIWDRNYSNVFALPNSGGDSGMYAYAAKQGYIRNYFSRGGQYAKYITYFVYRFFGIQRDLAQFTNVIFGMSTILWCIKIMDRLQITQKAKTTATVIISFLPNYCIMCAILLRESLMIYVITISLYSFICWWQDGKSIYFILAVALSIFSSTIHSGGVAPALGYAIILILYNRQTKQIQINRKSAVYLILMIVVVFVLNTAFGDTLFKKFQRVESVEDVVKTADSYTAGESAYEAGISTGNPTVDLIINTPIRMFYFIMSPLPWYWRGLNDIIAFFFSALFYGYCYYLAFKYIRSNTKNKQMLTAFLIIAASAALVFAWGVSNSGSALRHRDKFVSIYVILFAIGYNEAVLIREKREEALRLR